MFSSIIFKDAAAELALLDARGTPQGFANPAVFVHGTLMLSWTACCGRDAFLRILLFPNWQSLQNL